MNDHWVLVDGYSVLHVWPVLTAKQARTRSFAHRRELLVGLLQQYADQSGRRVTVVFDGQGPKYRPPAEPPAGLEVLFSPKGKTADDLIERLVGQAPRPAQILVVTSDRMERRIVEGLGALSMSAEAFAVEMEAGLAELAGLVRQHSRRSSPGTAPGLRQAHLARPRSL